MQRPGIAPKGGISENWLCQPCFQVAAKAAIARGAVHTVAQRGRRAKAEGELDAAKAIVRDFGKGQDLESVTAGFVSIVFEERVVEA